MHGPFSLRRAISFFLLVVSLAVRTGAEPLDETQRWVPAIGLFSGVFGQKADASTDSTGLTYLLTTRSSPNSVNEVVTVTEVTDANLRPPVDGDDILVTPFVGGTVELMTPGLQSAPGRPRLFVRGDVSGAFGNERKVAREKAPSSLPDPLPTQPYFAEEAVPGIGSQTTAEVQPLAVSAGAGVAFSLDVGPRCIRIKPSVEYFREEIDFTGSVIRAVNTDTGITAQGPIVEKPSVFFGVTLKQEESQAFQGIGPGLEVEMDTVRTGPFMLSIFANGRGVKVLGDRKVEFSDSTTVTDPAMIPNTTDFEADWEFEKKPWIFGGGVGVRLRWLPE